MQDKNYDLFLNCDALDVELVKPLVRRLSTQPVRVWFQQWELIPEEQTTAVGDSALSRSIALGVCVGPAGADIHGPKIEAATQNGLVCIPILLPGSDKQLPVALAQFEVIDFTGSPDEALAKLIAALQKTAKPGVQAAPGAPSAREPDPVDLAKDILRGKSSDAAEIRALAKKLKKLKRFGYARRLLAKARALYSANLDANSRLFLGQQQALCTYKDPDLSYEKFDLALGILAEVDHLPTTIDQETLGLAGAIHKYKGEALGQKSDLERSLSYYLRGYQAGPEIDFGYTGINAAYMLDLLAHQESNDARVAGTVSQTAADRTQLATEIRTKLIQVLPPLQYLSKNEDLGSQWWFLVTVAEALFGLKRYDEALYWLEKGKARSVVEDWEFESTARQLASIARLQAGPEWDVEQEQKEHSEAWRTVAAFLGPEKAAGVRSVFLGRVGLALSGGGFRASFFHIGVLARLAELDVLRHVEILSCVSGGSIIGAHYYLELRKLLQTKVNPSREDYIELVRRLDRDFLAGVQRNIRTRMLASFTTNLKMMFVPEFSRTEEAGNLFEEEIYSKIDDGGGTEPRYLNRLTIQPAGEGPGFSPKEQNWRRATKAPILVLNATALNTGHNWQFTATWMGEPPAGVDSNVDANYRLRRLYYDGQAPEGYRDFRLGRAVAASAAVPGLFEPINLTGLYPDINLRLVDGGVHDNQGVSSLLEQGCSVLLVSDASGQMESVNKPGEGTLSTLLRSNSVLQARIRVAEFHDLDGRRTSGLLRSLMFLHMKRDLESDAKNWVKCEDPVEASDEARPAYLQGPLTRYGIRKDVQEQLAAIRTDLDSFHEVEAFALMTSGYRMAEYDFKTSVTGFPKVPQTTPTWRFLDIEKPMKQINGAEREHAELMRLLGVSNCLGFKIWQLRPELRVMGIAILVILALAFFGLAFFGPEMKIVTLRSLAVLALTAGAAAVLGKTAVRAIRFRDTVQRFLLGIGMCFGGFLIARLHLWTFDPMYLKLGLAKRILPAPPNVAGK